MSDEAVVPQQDSTEQPKVNVEEPVVAKPNDGGETDPQTDETEGDPEEVTPHKRKGGWQRKIERLEREQAYWREVALSRSPVPSQTAPAPKAEEEEVEPDPESFETTAEYLKAVRAYDRKQIEKAVEAKLEAREKEVSHKTQIQSKESVLQSKVDKYAESHPEFKEAISDPTLPISKAMYAEILETEKAAEVLDFLAENPNEAARIARMDERQTAREIARIEARIASQTAPAKEEAETVVAPPPPPVSKAPAPPTPIKKASATKAIDPTSPESDKLPADEWLRARNAQLKRK